MTIIRPYDIRSLQEYNERGQKQEILYLFCLDELQNTILIRIDDFYPYVYIELPKIDNEGDELEWDTSSAEEFMENVKRKLKDNFINYRPVFGKVLYYFTPDRRPFIKLHLLSLYNDDFKELKCQLERGFNFRFQNRRSRAVFKVHEANITTIAKFLAELKINPCDYLEINDPEITDLNKRRSVPKLVEYEYHLSYKQLKVAQGEFPMFHPRILIFDIECHSDNPNRMPQRNEISDEIFAISCIMSYAPNKTKNYIITSGESKAVKDSEIIKVDDEVELLMAFQKFILEHNPHLITGYNIHGFDLQYIYHRLNSVHLLDFIPLSMLKNQQVYIPNNTDNNSRAFGRIDNFIFVMLGRIYFDLYVYMRKNYKFSKYSLDFVSETLLGSHKDDMPYQEMFAIFKSQKSGLTNKNIDDMTRVLEYCVQDSRLVLQMLAKLHIWIELLETANIVQVSVEQLYLRGQQMRCVYQIYKLAHSLGVIIDSRERSKIHYTGGMVSAPVVGVHNLVACLDFASLYPSIIMAHNICYTTLIPNHKIKAFEEEYGTDKYHHINVSQEEVYEEEDSDDDLLTISRKKKTKTGQQVEYNFYFVKDEVYRGILPQLVKALVQHRREVRKQSNEAFAKAKNIRATDGSEAEALKWELEGVILDKRQLALKVSANSLYGFLGVQSGGQLPLIEGAMAVTAKGRQLTGGVNDMIVEKWPNCQIIYNDTDSTMFKVSGVSADKVFDAVEEMAIEINKTFEDPLKMELEKIMVGAFFKKKKYCYLCYNRDGSLDLDPRKITFKGLEPARRENCKFMKTLYIETMLNIFQGHTFREIAGHIINQYFKLLSGQVPTEELVMYMGMGAYKPDTSYYLKPFKDRLNNHGYNIEVGERVEFVIAQDKSDKIGDKLRLTDELKKNPAIEIDYQTYLIRKIQKPIDNILNVAFGYLKEKVPELYYQPPRRGHPIHAIEVGKLLCLWLKYRKDPAEYIQIYNTFFEYIGECVAS